MSSRVFRLHFAILVTFAALSSRPAAAQEVTSALAKVVSFPAANSVNELYVSIMGEVERPGTYRLTPSTLKLHSVVRCAHGFTANASTAIRVIRRGRASQTEIFSEKIDSPVLPGDLLLVESKKTNTSERNYSDVSAGGRSVTRADYSDAGRRSMVQVALLNVVDYPVVLRLHPDEANASYLTQALGQPIALLANTHIITPDVPRRQSSEAAKKAVQLQDGSVIVFQPGKVKKHRIPPILPSPIDRETALASQFGLKHPSRPTRDLRQIDRDSYAEQFDTLDPGRQKFGDLLAPPDDGLASETENSSENPANADSLTLASETVESPIDESMQPEEDLEPQADTLSMSIGSSLTTDESIEEEPPKFSFIRVLVIFLIVGTLVGAAHLLRRFLVVESTDVSSTPDSIDVIQMSAARTPAPGDRLPVKTLLELSLKGDSAKPHGLSGLTSTSHRQGEPIATTSATAPRSEVDLKENVLKFDQSDRTVVAAGQSASSPASESPIIPFRIPNFASATPRYTASPEMTTEVPIERNPVPGPSSQPAPLATALFQLERGRRS